MELSAAWLLALTIEGFEKKKKRLFVCIQKDLKILMTGDLAQVAALTLSVRPPHNEVN